jgi:pyruvate dehydrogenase E2 component (dihydrolipoamide acetyltransferase)
MAKILDMPKLSPTMEEGQVAAWHKKEGDAVGVDDLLAEVETDKATMEFRAFDKGTLLKILAPAGTMVKLGQPVAILGNAGEDISALLSQAGGGEPATKSPPAAKKGKAEPEPEPEKKGKAKAEPEKTASAKEKPDAEEEEEGPADEEEETDGEPAGKDAADKAGTAARKTPPTGPGDDRVRASPYVRKLAREQDLDLHAVEGTGPHGRIIARDLENAPRTKAPKKAPAAGERREAEVKPLSMMRKTIARRLTESKQKVPHFYLTVDVDAGSLSALRERINDDLAAFARKDEAPEKISINDLLIKACALALVEVPECNAEFGGDTIVYHRRVDISVAVAVAEGLVTPVLRDADRKSVREIAREVRELAGRAKTKKLTVEEMTNGTFSISNLGMFGVDSFSAVINPPEGAILAVGRVREEPVVMNGAVVPGKKLAMTLSCDHRVIDGAIGARFLAALRKLVERPTGILIG